MSVIPASIQYSQPQRALNIRLNGISASVAHANPHAELLLPDSKSIVISGFGDVILQWQSFQYFPDVAQINARMAHGIELPPKRTVRNLSNTFPSRRTVADPGTFRFRLRMDILTRYGAIIGYDEEVAIAPSEHRTEPTSHTRQIEFVRVERLYWRLQSQVVGV